MKLTPHFLSLAVSTLLFTSGCATSVRGTSRPLDYPIYRIYLSTFDRVWDATVRVLDIYSITVANRESGLLQTEWSDQRFSNDLYDHPDKEQFLEEVKYRLKIKLSKAMVSETHQAAVRVQVVKEQLKYKNIYTDWERVATDLYEEQVLLYRIGQKLAIIEEQKRKSTSSPDDEENEEF